MSAHGCMRGSCLLAGAGRYGDGGNLYLIVQKTGTASWEFQYKLPGRSRRYSMSAIAPERGHAVASGDPGHAWDWTA